MNQVISALEKKFPAQIRSWLIRIGLRRERGKQPGNMFSGPQVYILIYVGKIMYLLQFSFSLDGHYSPRGKSLLSC